MGYRFLPHTADVKFISEGKTIEEAFSNAAAALKQTMAKNINVKTTEKKIIEVSGKDLESLLYEFLEEILYLFDAENFLIKKVDKIKINKEKDKFSLDATFIGDKASNYEFTNPVKAVTYNEMLIKKEKDKFIVQAVLDV